MVPEWKPKCPSMRMDTQNVVCLCHGKSFGSKKKQCSDTYCNMDKPEKHHAKQKKLVTKDDILYDSILMKCPEKANL